MPAQVVTDAATWAQPISQFAQAIDTAWRCNTPAVEAGDLERTYPSQSKIAALIGRADRLVGVDLGTANEIRGYVVARDGAPRGGGRVQWIGVSPAERAAVIAQLLDLVCDRYGWAWGRVANLMLRGVMLDIPAFGQDQSDPQIVHYRKPDG